MAEALDLVRLRACLSPRPGNLGNVFEDGPPDAAMTPAAVLFPIVLHDDSPTVLLTRRTDHLRDHAGQISFPGGRVETSDAGPVDAALRETEEEIGLPARQVEIVGYLPEYRTGTGFAVTPVVGFVSPPLSLSPDPFEVAEVFEVPLSFLLDPVNHRQHEIHWRGRQRRYFAMPYGDRFIWGATAGMIVSLCRRLALLPPD
ncbi:MAG: CoA pyrophosphatase [Rhodocyclaceae bacterium]|jgi:8-oxo-dGTP pyrophosphatase MutT (NUDIX family)|nr:CoA pyrophosphatase [Rhodocyclaceae bacterium]